MEVSSVITILLVKTTAKILLLRLARFHCGEVIEHTYIALLKAFWRRGKREYQAKQEKNKKKR